MEARLNMLEARLEIIERFMRAFVVAYEEATATEAAAGATTPTTTATEAAAGAATPATKTTTTTTLCLPLDKPLVSRPNNLFHPFLGRLPLFEILV